MFKHPRHIYNICGQISSLPVFWEAVVGGKVIKQIGGDGMVCRKRSSLPLEEIEYWGIVCEHGKCGFDIKQQNLDCFGKLIPVDIDKNIDKLDYKRSIIVDSDGNEQTAWVEIGIDNKCLKVIFLPKFEVNLINFQDSK